MSNQSSNCLPCGIQTFRRNTFFNGKLLTERDLNAEQAYFMGKDHLHNSLLHGVGTVCGLKVVAHPNPACRDQFVVIEPGLALDCCGREIILTQKVLVPIMQKNSAGVLVPVVEMGDGDEPVDLLISLCYDEKSEEVIPVLLPDCDCADANSAPNRVRESYRVHLFLQRTGQRPPAVPPLNAKIEWLHTLTFERQSPRALAIDEESKQLYLATQSLEEGGPARLYLFNAENHDLIATAQAGNEPVDLATSLLGDRIYLATTMPRGEASGPVIAVFQEESIRTSIDPRKTISLPGAARLLVSPATRALYALVLNSGGADPKARLLRWDDDTLLAWLEDDTTDLAPALNLEIGNPLDEGSAANILTITPDGKYIFIADRAGGRIIGVDLAANAPSSLLIPSHGQPLAIVSSRDGKFLNVLWEESIDGVNNAHLARYTINTGGALGLLEAGRGARWAATPLDLAIAPNEHWAYVLQELGEKSEVCAIDLQEVAKSGSSPFDTLGTRAGVAGDARFEKLALLGGRIYVAADDDAPEQPERGLVAVLDVLEEACEDRFNQAIDGCPSCETGSGSNGDPGDDNCGGHCVVLATLERFRPGRRILNADEAGPDDNIIDNLKHRPLVPSTNTIVDVIRCLLEQGLARGVPGPRGEPGEQGVRGPGITEVTVSALAPTATPTAVLEPIEGDFERDQRLALGIPRGQRGATGARGPGITEVAVETLDAGEVATARLDPIAGDPEGDQILTLGIPRGPGGDDPDLTHIVGTSWSHEANFTFDELIKLLNDPNPFEETPREAGIGLVISFDREIQVKTVLKPEINVEAPISEVYQLYIRLRDQTFDVDGEYLLPGVLCQPVEVLEPGDGVGLIRVISPLAADKETARAMRLVLPDFDQLASLIDRQIGRGNMFMRVLLRADFVLDTSDPAKAVDGNNIGGLVPGRPSGNGRQGDSFESWFNIVRDL